MSSSFERRAFADQLSIETPEQVALEFPVAGIGSRFVAVLLDHLIQLGVAVAIFLVILVVIAATGGRAEHSLGNKWFYAGVIVALVSAALGLFFPV